MREKKVVYLDFHASTPCAPEVVAAMLPYFAENFANPSSSIHRPGKLAGDAVSEARETIGQAIGARSQELVFTSGATESNNIAILGVARQASADRRHIITSAIEHKSVLRPCEVLRSEGFEVTVLPVNTQGLVDLADLEKALKDTTLLVSIQAANNEIGTLQPIGEISRLAHERGALFHCDAAQAVGKVPVDVLTLDVDLLSISAHKLYGPKGVGCLYMRDGVRGLPVAPLMYGGGQESGMRPGTLNVPAIVGFGKAAQLAVTNLDISATQISQLRDSFEDTILTTLPGTRRNGCLNHRLAGNSSLTFQGVDAEALISNLPEIAISTGSACTNGAPDPSHVLLAIGVSRADALSTIRICVGKETSSEDLDLAARQIVEAVQKIRNLAAI